MNKEKYIDPNYMPDENTSSEIESLNKQKKDLSNFNLKMIDEFGIDGDFVESQAFAYLAIRSFLNLPISFPETTGCKAPCTGGVIVKNY